MGQPVRPVVQVPSDQPVPLDPRDPQGLPDLHQLFLVRLEPLAALGQPDQLDRLEEVDPPGHQAAPPGQRVPRAVLGQPARPVPYLQSQDRPVTRAPPAPQAILVLLAQPVPIRRHPDRLDQLGHLEARPGQRARLDPEALAQLVQQGRSRLSQDHRDQPALLVQRARLVLYLQPQDPLAQRVPGVAPPDQLEPLGLRAQRVRLARRRR